LRALNHNVKVSAIKLGPLSTQESSLLCSDVINYDITRFRVRAAIGIRLDSAVLDSGAKWALPQHSYLSLALLSVISFSKRKNLRIQF